MATCNPSTLLASASCFQCLSKKELQAIIAQLLCNISDGSGGGVYTGADADPNGVVTPGDTTKGNLYYQYPSTTLYNQWLWDVPSQTWLQSVSP